MKMERGVSRAALGSGGSSTGPGVQTGSQTGSGTEGSPGQASTNLIPGDELPDTRAEVPPRVDARTNASAWSGFRWVRTSVGLRGEG